MERSQFTFYESFAKALARIKNKSVRCAAYDAVVAYALRGELPDLEALPDAAAIVFDLIKPTLDTSARKSEAGRAGGRAKQSESKAEANRKQSASKAEAKRKQSGSEWENENENEV